MDEKALLLSEVYTEMEIEKYSGRGNKKTVVPLNDYKDLFKNVEPQGTRILVKGDPGIGKSTFVQKLAFDWATKQLVMFDVVLVVKLKFTDKTQSIARMVKNQIKTLSENDQVSEIDIANYMKSGRDRILLVLDGLDEINLKQYPQVREVLHGERYRKCCILATTRPHVAETLYNKMTNVAKIKVSPGNGRNNLLDTYWMEKNQRNFSTIEPQKNVPNAPDPTHSSGPGSTLQGTAETS